MGTRSMIGILNADGTVTAVYCHWDGYPSHNGAILLKHYSDEKTLRKLLRLGSLSSLGKQLGEKHEFNTRLVGSQVCTFYRRDRGDDYKETKSVSIRDANTFARQMTDWDSEYAYLFDPKHNYWGVAACDNGRWESLEGIVINHKFTNDEFVPLAA